IKINLEPFPNSKDEVYILTTFKETDIEEIEVEQEIYPKKPKKFKWENLFLCGYGASRRQYGARAYSEYTVTDAVYTLFNYNQELQNPELNIRRANSIGIKEDDIFRALEKILMLEENSITLDVTGFKVSGPWGSKMPMGALGDGYQATIAWILDLYGWVILFDNKIDKIELSGIVLLDEIEHHLHPMLQKRIIKLLSTQFPKIQFVVTTHSPLSAVGTTELTDRQCIIAVLEQKEDKVIRRITTPPRGKRVDQVLTSYLFDLYTVSDNSIKRDIERYSHLYNKERSTEEELEMNNISKSLDEVLGSAETELEELVENAVQKTLEDLTKEQINKQKFLSPVQLEIRRQLDQLFK
ncbi:MAG: AAA family ATPase, partial [Ignavibacteria bacterium]|nr:AAA family ATPase [Ignavibacteria bacterium]